MSNERGDAPRVEASQGQTAENGKEKRVAPYFFPNVLLAVLAAVLSSSPKFTPVFLIAASLSIPGSIFALCSLIANADGDGKKAVRRARVARILFWANFLVLTVPLILWMLVCELHDLFGLF